MQSHNRVEETLIKKIRTLPPEKLDVLAEFVEFLRQRDDDRLLVKAAARLSENAFRRVWDNPDDADYDHL